MTPPHRERLVLTEGLVITAKVWPDFCRTFSPSVLEAGRPGNSTSSTFCPEFRVCVACRRRCCQLAILLAEGMASETVDERVEKSGFALLKGENLEVYVRKYVIELGRRSKSTKLDVVLGKRPAQG